MTVGPNSSGVRIRQRLRMPLLDPSQTGFAITGSGNSDSASIGGNSAKLPSYSPGGNVSVMPLGSVTPADSATRRVMSLSSATARASGSEPVQGTPSISQTAGT